MAAPNLRSPTVVTGRSSLVHLGASLAAVLSNPAASGKVLKVTTMRAANVGTLSAVLEIAHSRSPDTVYLLKGGTVDSGKALIATDKNEYHYLEESDELLAKGSGIDLTISYEEIS